MAITDRNTLAGVVRAHAAAKELQLKLLIGAEIDLIDAPPVVLWATDRAAYGRLARLITHGRRQAPKGEFRLSFDELATYAEGLLCGVLPRRPQEFKVTISSEGEAPAGPELGGDSKKSTAGQASSGTRQGKEPVSIALLPSLAFRASERAKLPLSRSATADDDLAGCRLGGSLALPSIRDDIGQANRGTDEKENELIPFCGPLPDSSFRLPPSSFPQPQVGATGGDHDAWLLDALRRYRELFGDRAYLLGELSKGPDDAQVLARLVELARRSQVPLVAAGDVHYHARSRLALQDVLTAIRLGTTVAEAGERLFPNAERHLKSPDGNGRALRRRARSRRAHARNRRPLHVFARRAALRISRRACARRARRRSNI